MKLVKLEDVLAIVNELQWSNINKFRMSVESLPTHDPIKVLKEMIEAYDELIVSLDYGWKRRVLQEALSRITKQ